MGQVPIRNAQLNLRNSIGEFEGPIMKITWEPQPNQNSEATQINKAKAGGTRVPELGVFSWIKGSNLVGTRIIALLLRRWEWLSFRPEYHHNGLQLPQGCWPLLDRQSSAKTSSCKNNNWQGFSVSEATPKKTTRHLLLIINARTIA